MIIVNTETIAGKEIVEVLGLVKGNTVQAKHFGKDFMSGLKNIVGGEMHAYTEMLDDARRISTDRMVKEAQRLGADAIVNVRYATSAIVQGAAEILVYGTAVRLK